MGDNIVAWENRTKTIQELIQELQSFENQDLVVMVTDDEGKSFNTVKLVSKGFASVKDGLNDAEKVFRTTDRVITAANIIAYDGTAKTVTLAGKVTGIKEGEKVATSTAVAYTTSITFDGTNTVVGLTASLGNSTVDLTFKGVLFESIYLADDMSGDLPFTLVPNAESVGKVVSAIAVEIDLR